MPTGIFSLGTIATRLRAAADSPTLGAKTFDDLTACALTLEGGWPSSKQLRAIAKAVADVDQANPDLNLARCVSSLDYWVSNITPKSKPQWMLDIEQAEVEPAVATNGHAWALAGVIKKIVDNIVAGDYDDSDFEALNALVVALKEFA